MQSPAKIRLKLVVLMPGLFLAIPLSEAMGGVSWNDCGHRVIAAIAFEQLDPTARQAVVALLREHPAAKDATFWAGHENNSTDPDLNLFLNAAVFPDDAKRPGPFKQYDIGRAHYVNFRIVAEADGTVEVLPPNQDLEDDDPHGDVLESLATNLQIAGDASAEASTRALALSWVLHQVGDLHQPLHNVARFSAAFPNGDRGGNEVRLGERNLHGYWDWGLGGDASAENVTALASELLAEHPRNSFTELLAEPSPISWSGEGVDLALRYVYRNLDPSISVFPEVPIGYEADTRSLARRQCALAGYRLADLLASAVNTNSPAAPAAHKGSQ